MVLARWQSSIVDEEGNVQPTAQVTVRREEAGAPLAVLYSDRDGTVPLGNPFPADADGFAAFYTAGGPLRIDVVSGAFSQTLRYVAQGLLQERDTIAGDGQTLVENALLAADNAGLAKVYEGNEAPTNLNDLTHTSIVPADSSTSNRPGDTGNWLVMTMRRTANIAIQLALSRATGTAGRIYQRIKDSDVWGAWVRMLSTTDVASDSDIRSSAAATATDAQLVSAANIASASLPVQLTDAATVAVNWNSFISAHVTLAGNRTLGNPTNMQKGTHRTLEVRGDGTNRTLAFDTNYRGATTTITNINNGLGARALIGLYAEEIGGDHVVVTGVTRY